MAGGNNDQMLNMGLMIAAGIAAPALAPALMSGGALGLGLGATAATGLTGAALGGAAGALTGQDPLKAAVMGGLGGAASGAFGGVNAAEPGSMLASSTNVPATATQVPSTLMDATLAGSTTPYQMGQQIQMYPADLAEMPANLPSNTLLGNLPSAQNAGIPYGQNALPGQGGITSVMNPTPAYYGASNQAQIIGGGIAGINALMQPPPGAYVPPGASYTGGSLSKFKYDPSSYQPDIVRPPNPVYKAQYAQNPYGYKQLASGGIASLYADGGTVEQMSRDNALGGNQMFPQSGINSLTGANRFQNATNTPMSSDVVMSTDYDGQRGFAKGGATTNSFSDLMKSRDSMDEYMAEYASNPSSVYQKAKNGDYNAMLVLNRMKQTPNQNYASGGITELAVGGKLLRGNGDGMSDDIRANIEGRQEARLADGEFVIPADVVSHLGNGSTDAGAKQLYSMMDRVRQARVGNKKQGKQINPAKYMTA